MSQKAIKFVKVCWHCNLTIFYHISIYFFGELWKQVWFFQSLVYFGMATLLCSWKLYYAQKNEKKNPVKAKRRIDKSSKKREELNQTKL